MMDQSSLRKVGALWAITHGIVTAIAPRKTSVKMTKNMLRKNFENADDLEAKSGYVRQLRALGIGLAAAGIAGLTMEKVAESKDEDSQE
ncbi:hypothetical protein K0C01_11350 [Salinarchaeum sp. IM2453]|uniref:hypothetical protein n=1 Tax=Salinarchaeum sp. IM2453 TaxID=2862870 RepID=UPI001C835B2B|nr:hypothetical protein [Salinarchaeum sp. IM2453]QZA88367.1 hypothetical protein K0C01_11350 [Salinarchaeum sp. IM2453]